MDRWIKLYVKIWESKRFQGRRNKPAMLLVWIWWLTHCREGKCTYGIRQIAKDTGLNKSAVYRAIAALINDLNNRNTSETEAKHEAKHEAKQEVKHEANHLFSTVYILNWHKYQDKPKQEAKQQPKQEPNANRNGSETEAKHNKNRIDIYNIYNANEKKIISIFPEIVPILEFYQQTYGIKTISRRLENIRAARTLLKDYGLEAVKRSITWAYQASGEKYAPMIGDLISLKDKYSTLQMWVQRTGRKKTKDEPVGEIRNALGKVISQGGK